MTSSLHIFILKSGGTVPLSPKSGGTGTPRTPVHYVYATSAVNTRLHQSNKAQVLRVKKGHGGASAPKLQPSYPYKFI